MNEIDYEDLPSPSSFGKACENEDEDDSETAAHFRLNSSWDAGLT